METIMYKSIPHGRELLTVCRSTYRSKFQNVSWNGIGKENWILPQIWKWNSSEITLATNDQGLTLYGVLACRNQMEYYHGKSNMFSDLKALVLTRRVSHCLSSNSREDKYFMQDPGHLTTSTRSATSQSRSTQLRARPRTESWRFGLWTMWHLCRIG